MLLFTVSLCLGPPGQNSGISNMMPMYGFRLYEHIGTVRGPESVPRGLLIGGGQSISHTTTKFGDQQFARPSDRHALLCPPSIPQPWPGHIIWRDRSNRCSEGGSPVGPHMVSRNPRNWPPCRERDTSMASSSQTGATQNAHAGRRGHGLSNTTLGGRCFGDHRGLCTRNH